MYYLKIIKTLPLLRTLLASLVMAALIFSAGPIQAHPHVFIESSLAVVFNKNGIKGIEQQWTFDEFFSSWVIDEYDKNRDGKFSQEETDHLFQEAFKNLKNYGYWTRVFQGTNEHPIEKVENFTVSVSDNMVTYSFFMPLDLKLSRQSGQNEVFIAVYDEDFYCQIFFPPRVVELNGAVDEWSIEQDTVEMEDLTYYFGFVTPVAVRLSINPL
ncbi:DUF1007 family protein [Desulfonatronovibrio magnus]|uniref:DUF1007 family protein n=1 Tax=Desulfonatronovibrio magnus TaxID=698827 RepID=UPI000696D2D3|nr:DUF1007 family protein [Desulfonatronovibrio magnus]